MAERTCVVCDDPFDKSAGAGGTCSTRCMMWAKRYPGDKPDKVRTCLMCSTEFEVVHRAARYCTAKCRAAASKRRCRPIKKPYVRHTACVACGDPMPLDAKAGTKRCSIECGRRDKEAERAMMLCIGTRRCTHCGSEFTPRNRRNITCSPHCSGLAHYYANREAYLDRTMRWFAENPERRRENARAWQVRNADYVRTRNLAWTRAHPERVAVHGQRRRASKVNNPGSVGVSLRDWQRALNRAAGRCFYCGEKWSGTPHMDHVVPLSRGGRHAIGNVVPTCARCNLRKHDKLVSEWRGEVMRRWLPDARRHLLMSPPLNGSIATG